MAACPVISLLWGRHRDMDWDGLLDKAAIDRLLSSDSDEGHLFLWSPSP